MCCFAWYLFLLLLDLCWDCSPLAGLLLCGWTPCFVPPCWLLDLYTGTILSPLSQKCLSLGLLLSLGTGPLSLAGHWSVLSLLALTASCYQEFLKRKQNLSDLEKTRVKFSDSDAVTSNSAATAPAPTMEYKPVLRN